MIAWIAKLLAAIFGRRLPPEPPAPVASDNFLHCVDFVLSREGGFVERSDDPGGATNMGITLATLSHWRGTACTAADVRGMSKAEAVAIYRADFWYAMRCDQLPAGVDLSVLDSGVMSGPAQGIKFLQQAAGVAADGVLGPKTLSAVQMATAGDLVQRIADEREAFYRRLDRPQFLTGWLARVHACEVAAKAMVR